MDKLLLTAQEVADLLGVGRTKVFELMRTERLVSVRIGTCRRVPADALREFVAVLAAEAPE